MKPETKRENSVLTVSYEGNVIVYSVLGVGDLRLDTSKMHPDNLAHAAMHGMEQRIRDAAAIPRDKDTGASATPQDKYDAMKRLVDHYESGTAEWTIKRAEGAGTGSRSITIEAIARVKECDYETAESMVDRFAMSKFAGDRKPALRELAKTPSVQSAIAAIRAERMPKPKADGDALLNELG